jgi:hypothetical protein
VPVRIQPTNAESEPQPGKRADNLHGSVLALPNNRVCQSRRAGAATAAKTAAFILMQKTHQNVKLTSPNTPTLAEELEKARFTFAMLKRFTTQEEFEADFKFIAPNREAANALSGKLKAETNYNIRIDPFDRQGKYWVVATTQLMPLTLPVLDQCVARMVNYAKQHACIYDGWGTLATLE